MQVRLLENKHLAKLLPFLIEMLVKDSAKIMTSAE